MKVVFSRFGHSNKAKVAAPSSMQFLSVLSPSMCEPPGVAKAAPQCEGLRHLVSFSILTKQLFSGGLR